MLEIGKLYKTVDKLAYVTATGETVDEANSIVLFLGVFEKKFFVVNQTCQCACFLLLSQNEIGWWDAKTFSEKDYCPLKETNA